MTLSPGQQLDANTDQQARVVVRTMDGGQREVSARRAELIRSIPPIDVLLPPLDAGESDK